MGEREGIQSCPSPAASAVDASADSIAQLQRDSMPGPRNLTTIQDTQATERKVVSNETVEIYRNRTVTDLTNPAVGLLETS